MMKILMINKFWYNRGGSETYTFSLSNLLKSKGHKIIPFSMHHKDNFPNVYSNDFVSNIDFVDSLKNFGMVSSFKVASRNIYSLEAKRKIENLIKTTRPDIAHLHNIHHHLTPSILHPLKKHNIPIIWTLHDYRLICPNSTFIKDGKICEKCKGKRYFEAVLAKCKKGSSMASLMAAIESYVHRYLGFYKLVAKFVTPSRFLREKLIEYGFDEKRIVHIPNFIGLKEINSKKLSYPPLPSNYFVYIGRLSQEKGVDILIRAALEIKKAHLIIAGEGPIRKELEELASANGNNIRFLGHLKASEINSLLKNAMFLVIPSTWYENFPYSVLEAFAWGKPVVASRIGGIPEQVKEEDNGLLFEPWDKENLRKKIDYLLANRYLLSEMGERAREKVEREYSAELHYQRLMNVYQQVLS